MAAFKGKNFLLQLGSTATVPVYTTIGGQQNTAYNGSNAPIDVTTKDSNFARTLLDSAGLISAQVVVSGLYMDDASILTVDDLHRSGALRAWKVINDNGDAWTFSGKVTQTNFGGAHDGAENYSITIETSGAITRTMST